MKRPVLAVTMAVTGFLFPLLGTSASAAPTVVQISTDPFSNPTVGQHHTEVEPDIFSHGSTIVAAFQQGRIFDGGSTDPGWASHASGHNQHGSLPGLTVNSNPAGPYARASDPAVAYDAKHGQWLISTLGIDSGGTGVAVAVNRSADGITWGNAIVAAAAKNFGDFFDKDWIVCDNTSTSPYYGHCYIEFDNAGQGDVPYVATSTDGGQTWTTPVTPSGNQFGLGGQPLVQPNGNVIVPFEGNGIDVFSSTNGGQSFGNEVQIATIQYHGEAGNLRASPLPSAEIDKSGKVYVTWGDCRFESGCSANDIVLSTSTDGVTWSSVSRIPIDPVGSGVDHFIPGIGVDRATQGNSTHLALTYYYYPQSNCNSSCQLDVGYVSSTNAGASWSSSTQLTGPLNLSWLAVTNQGPMVGDYIATTILNGSAYPVFASAKAPNNGVLNESMYSGRLSVTGGAVSAPANERVVGVGPYTLRPGHLTAY